MASVKLKTAYVLFLFSFFVWLSVLLLVFFPAGKLANPVSFPNLSMLMLFCGSAIVASITCIIIGVDYLGLNFGLRQGPKTVKETPRLLKTIPVSISATAADANGVEPQDSAEEEETVSILVPEPIEEEQETE